jgi:hypothetical protein
MKGLPAFNFHRQTPQELYPDTSTSAAKSDGPIGRTGNSDPASPWGIAAAKSFTAGGQTKPLKRI